MTKTKVACLESRLFQANRIFEYATVKIGLIGWVKASLPKKLLLFSTCKQVNIGGVAQL